MGLIFCALLKKKQTKKKKMPSTLKSTLLSAAQPPRASQLCINIRLANEMKAAL